MTCKKQRENVRWGKWLEIGRRNTCVRITRVLGSPAPTITRWGEGLVGIYQTYTLWWSSPWVSDLHSKLRTTALGSELPGHKEHPRGQFWAPGLLCTTDPSPWVFSFLALSVGFSLPWKGRNKNHHHPSKNKERKKNVPVVPSLY